MAGMGSVYRIRECALELLAMEDDLVDGSLESSELVGQELRLKSTFLYCDLNQVIRSIENLDQKRSLTELANKLLHYIEELGEAVKNRSLLMAPVCHTDTAQVLQEVMAALPLVHTDTAQVLQEVMAALPLVHSIEGDAYWEMDENEME